MPPWVQQEAAGGAQSFTVPAGATHLTVAAYGAEGGRSILAGGRGGLVTATLAVTAGEVLDVYVGGKGIDSAGYGHEPTSGSFNGGGGSDGNAGAGGGASDLRRGGVKLVVAGGGGGAGTGALWGATAGAPSARPAATGS